MVSTCVLDGRVGSTCSADAAIASAGAFSDPEKILIAPQTSNAAVTTTATTIKGRRQAMVSV